MPRLLPKLFVLTVDIAVQAKTEREARDKLDTQLGYSDHSDYGSPEVENYNSNTRVLSVKEVPFGSQPQ